MFNQDPSANDLFRLMQIYQQLNFSDLLNQILSDRQINIADLYKMLSDQEYYVSQESLYRYFTRNPRSTRFPSQEFVEVFAKALQLTDEESTVLLQFWKHWKLFRKCKSSLL